MTERGLVGGMIRGLVLASVASCTPNQEAPPRVVVIERQLPAPTCTCIVVSAPTPPPSASTSAANAESVGDVAWEPGF